MQSGKRTYPRLWHCANTLSTLRKSWRASYMCWNFQEVVWCVYRAQKNEPYNYRLGEIVRQLEWKSRVKVVLAGHSMGGMVAAKTILDLDTFHDAYSLRLDHIKGILAFDTPLLGIETTLVANAADDYTQIVESTFSGLCECFWQDPTWNRRWGVLTAGITALVSLSVAYRNWDTLLAGTSWAGSHLEFVSHLVRKKELEEDLCHLTILQRSRRVGVLNLINVLSHSCIDDSYRTFCTLPPISSEERGIFHLIENGNASSEIEAHTQMFSSSNKDGYLRLCKLAALQICDWMWVVNEELQQLWPLLLCRFRREVCIDSVERIVRYHSLTPRRQESPSLPRLRGRRWPRVQHHVGIRDCFPMIVFTV